MTPPRDSDESTASRAPRRTARHRCGSVRRSRSCARPPCATSPTRPGSCPAASTTISIPRSRWSTRSCADSSTTSSDRYHKIVAAGLDSRATLEALVVTSYEAIDSRHIRRWRSTRTRSSTSTGTNASRTSPSGTPNSGTCGSVSSKLASPTVRFRAASRRRTRLPVHARHRVGRGALVPPGWRPHRQNKLRKQYLSIVLDGLSNPDLHKTEQS